MLGKEREGLYEKVYMYNIKGSSNPREREREREK